MTWCGTTRNGWAPRHRREGASGSHRGREFAFGFWILNRWDKRKSVLLKFAGTGGTSWGIGTSRRQRWRHEVIKGKVTLGYKVRERDEEQERGFNHSTCYYMSGVAHRCLPKLCGIDQQRYCSSQIEDGDLFPSLPVGWRWCSTAATILFTSWTVSYPFSPQYLPVSGEEADAALPYLTDGCFFFNFLEIKLCG